MGRLAVVFTDVEASTEKWERSPELMQEALMLHNELIRQNIKKYQGYEVKTEGDSFMVAFWSPVQCARFCVALQLDLLKADWPEVW